MKKQRGKPFRKHFPKAEGIENFQRHQKGGDPVKANIVLGFSNMKRRVHKKAFSLIFIRLRGRDVKRGEGKSVR